MTREHGLLFRNHVPSLVSCLEDADSGVRETAKTTVIDLFQFVASSHPSFIMSDCEAYLIFSSV